MNTQQKPKGGKLSRLAGMWCNNPVFWGWVCGKTHARTTNKEGARLFITTFCGVSSRAELDSNESAAQLFHEHIRKPFSKYLAQHTIQPETP